MPGLGLLTVSVCIGIGLGEAVLLCADGRYSYYGDDGNFAYHVDGFPKVHHWQRGIITAAGCAELIDAVVRRMATETTQEINDIRDIMRTERARILDQEQGAQTPNPVVMESCSVNTGWFFSIGMEEDGKPKIGLLVLHPKDNPDLEVEYLGDRGIITMPYGAPHADCRRYGDYLTSQLRPIDEFQNLRESISYHIGLAIRIVTRASEEFANVSRQIQLGVHRLDGTIIGEVTDIPGGDSLA